MSHSIPAASPVAPHRARRAALKAVAGMTIFTGAAAGLYDGAQAAVRHLNAPQPAVSYADSGTIARTLRQAWHTPATAGDFRPSASIADGDVVSVVKAVR